MIRGPAIKAQVGGDKGFVLDVIEQLHLAGTFLKRSQHLDRGVHQFRGDIAQTIDQPVEIKMGRVGPGTVERHAVRVHRRGKTHQIFERTVGIQGRVQHRQKSTQAIADHRHIGLARIFAHHRHTLGDEIGHIVVQPQMFMLPSWHTPVGQIHVKTLKQQIFDKTLAFGQVENIGPADQGHHDQDRNPIHLGAEGPIAVQLHCAACMHDVFRGRPNFKVEFDWGWQVRDVALNGAVNRFPRFCCNVFVRQLLCLLHGF